MTDENKKDLMTPALFNGLSTLEKAKYLRTHGEYLTGRNSYDRYLTKIYLVSDFFVEMTFDIKLEETVEDIQAIDPAQENAQLQQLRAKLLHQPYTAEPMIFIELATVQHFEKMCWNREREVKTPISTQFIWN